MQTPIQHTLGLIAAPPTGFTEDGSIDLAVVAPLAEHLHRHKVSGVFVNGTTGESVSLSVDERLALAAQWRRALPRSMKFFVHVGHDSLPEARRLAAHAAEIGADAIATMSPVFFKPPGLDELVDWCAAVAAAAPATPFYYYHIPSMTGVNLPVSRFLDNASRRIPTLAGAKFTFENLADYLQSLTLQNGRFDVLWGRDEMLLAALATGARGGVGSTYNVAAPLFLKLIHAFESGDLPAARRLQIQAIDTINAMVNTGNFLAAIKSMLRHQGVPINTRLRLPQRSLQEGSFKIPEVP